MDTSVVTAAAAVTEISIFKNRTSFDYGPVTKWLKPKTQMYFIGILFDRQTQSGT